MTHRSITRFYGLALASSLVAIALAGCSSTVGSVAAFKPDSVEPPPSERAALGATAKAGTPSSTPDAPPSRRLSLPAR